MPAIRVKVERIHNWVARNIRYVGIGFEDGGWTSQPASAVLASRYGDCKAHATILKALLAAQGIQANLVAVNTDMQYTLTEVATANFNHAIVYVPEIDHISTQPPRCRLSVPSVNLAGKPVLNIERAPWPNSGPGAGAFHAGGGYAVRACRRWYAPGSFDLSGTGLGASLGRSLAQELETVDRQNTARKLIEQADLKGKGDYSFPNPRELSDDYAITATFQISSRVDLGERWGFRLLPLTDPRPSLLLLSTGTAIDRPFRCRSLEYRETSVLTIPEETNFEQKPAPVEYQKALSGTTPYGSVNGRIEVRAAAVIEGRTVRTTARVLIMFGSAVCPAEFAAAIRGGLDMFSAFRHRRVVVTPKPRSVVWEVSTRFDEGVNAYLASNYEVAMARLTPFAESGNASAQAYLGKMYESGWGAERDYGEALRWFLKAADQGDAFSQAHAGYLYEQGMGVARDEQRAAELYVKAGGQGFAWAQMSLGLLYISGRGVPRDIPKGLSCFGLLPKDTMSGLNIISAGPMRAAPAFPATRRRRSPGTGRPLRPATRKRAPVCTGWAQAKASGGLCSVMSG